MRKPSAQSGQAVVEYVLMLAVAVIIVGSVAIGFRTAIKALWKGFNDQIAASCPGCKPNPGAQF